MQMHSVQQSPGTSAAQGPGDAAPRHAPTRGETAACERLPARFFAGPRIADLWPPNTRPVWARSSNTKPANGPPPGPAIGDGCIDAPAWTRAMQQNTRLWVRQFGTTLGQVNYFQQLCDRLPQHLPPQTRIALDSVPAGDGRTVLFSILPQIALRMLGHTPLPAGPEPVRQLVGSDAAILVWPVLLVAPSCADAALAEAVQQSLSPQALRHISDFGANEHGRAFLQAVRTLAGDPVVMTADMTVRNNLQTGLRDELQAMHRARCIARMRDMGEQLAQDVANLRDMLTEKQDLFLHATVELDRALIGLQNVDLLARHLRRGPGAQEASESPWEVSMLERVQTDVPGMHTGIANLLAAVGLGASAGPTLAMLFHPMG